MTAKLLIDTSRQEHVTVLTMNRPEKRNAYDTELSQLLAEALRAFDQDDDQYVAVLTGAGDLAFCAGRDMTERAEGGGRVDLGRGARGGSTGGLITDMMGVGSVAKPVIAAVNGLAVGGGAELALAADIRIASEDAWFGLFEPKRGIVAGAAVHLLPRTIGYGDAAWMLLTGERVPAAEAHRIGLVQRVVPPEQLLDEALRTAASICALSQVSVRVVKRVLRFRRDTMLREAINLSEAMHELLYLGDDAAEGVAAFAEKREPAFSNRWPRPDGRRA